MVVRKVYEYQIQLEQPKEIRKLTQPTVTTVSQRKEEQVKKQLSTDTIADILTLITHILKNYKITISIEVVEK